MTNIPWGNDPLNYLADIARLKSFDFDPGLVALAFSAREMPNINFKNYTQHLTQLTCETERQLFGEDTQSLANALRKALSINYGYEGDSVTYDDLRNANLVRVIDRRKGLPVAIGILYISVCRRLGWNMHGLSFPGHFLVSLNCGSEHVYIDPFEGGRSLTAADMRSILKRVKGRQAELTPECYQIVDDRDVILRLQNNIKLRRLRNGDLLGALRTLEGMLVFAPDANDLRREIGVIHLRLGNISQVINQLQAHMDKEADDQILFKIENLIAKLKRRVN